MQDPVVEAVLDTIGQRESGGNYYADATKTIGEPSWGKYQFLPATWASVSKDYLASIGEKQKPLPMTPENQDAVARFQVTRLLDQGLTPTQVYMVWASGRPNPTKMQGVNKYGNYYDLNQYAADFGRRFNKNMLKRAGEYHASLKMQPQQTQEPTQPQQQDAPDAMSLAQAVPINPQDIEPTSNVQEQREPDWAKVVADYRAGTMDPALSQVLEQSVKSGELTFPGSDTLFQQEQPTQEPINTTWEEPTESIQPTSSEDSLASSIRKSFGGGPISQAAGDVVEGLIKRPGENIGGMVGGFIGKSPMARAAGSTAGGAIGAIVDQIRKLGTITDPQQYAEELQKAKEMVAAGGFTQGLGQLVGEGITGAFNKVFAPSKNLFRTANKGSEESFRPYVQDAMPRGSKNVAGYSLGQRINSGVISGLEEATEKSMFGGGSRMSDYRQAQTEGLSKMTSDLADTLYQDSLGRIPDSDLAATVLDFAESKRRAYAKAGGFLYGKLDQEVAKRADPSNPTSGMVDLRPLKVDAIKQQQKFARKGGIGESEGGMNFIQKILDADDFLPFMEAHELRSSAYGEAYNFADRSKGRAAVQSFTDKLSNQMTKAASQLGGDVYPLWMVADNFWKNSVKGKFDTKFLTHFKTRLEDAPIQSLSELYNPKNVDGLLQFNRMLGNSPEANIVRNTMEARFVENLLTSVESSATDNVMGNTLKKRLDSYPDEYINAVFRGDKLDNVMKVVNAARTIQRRDPNRSPSGRSIMMTGQGLALGAAAMDYYSRGDARPLAVTAGTVIIAPKILAKLLLSPKVSSWIAEGLISSPKSPRIPALISKISAEAMREQGADETSQPNIRINSSPTQVETELKPSVAVTQQPKVEAQPDQVSEYVPKNIERPYVSPETIKLREERKKSEEEAQQFNEKMISAVIDWENKNNQDAPELLISQFNSKQLELYYKKSREARWKREGLTDKQIEDRENQAQKKLQETEGWWKKK